VRTTHPSPSWTFAPKSEMRGTRNVGWIVRPG